MSRMRPVTPEEMGKEAAEMFVALHAELKAKGIDVRIAEEIVKNVAGAASSYWDGHCGEMFGQTTTSQPSPLMVTVGK